MVFACFGDFVSRSAFGVRQITPVDFNPYCYLFSRELNFAKMEWAYFAGLKFRDLAKKIRKIKKLYFEKFAKILNCIYKQLVSELAQLILILKMIVFNNDTSRGQRKILSPRRESNPWPPRYRLGALTN